MSGRDYYQTNQNQYLVEPKDHERFYPSRAKQYIKEVVVNNLEDYEIDEVTIAEKTEEITKLIRESLKDNLNLKRYKYIVQVIIGSLEGQGIRVTSKCLWDTNSDNYISYTYKTDKFYCTSVVFGLYKE